MSSNPETMFGSSSNTSGDSSNPVKSDPELIGLLKRLDQVKKYKTFTKWKAKFLDRLESFLYQDGMAFANKATTDFETTLQKFVKKIVAVQACIERGDLTETKKTVKSSLALNEMCNSLELVRVAVQDLIPSSSQDEKQRKFTKFHLGAVLIRQGFHQYVTLKQMQDALTVIGDELKNVADRQQLDLFAAYSTQLQRFCDVLADLNLYEIMIKCIEFAEAPEEEESSDEEVVMIPIVVEHAVTGKSIQLEVDQTETVENLKQMIANFCGMEPARQVLTHKGDELGDNEQSLVAAGVGANSKLMVSPYKIPVTVKTMDGKSIPLMVDPGDYVSDIKRQLEAESGLAPNNQKLYLAGDELADNTKRVGDYGVTAGAVLDLEPKAITVNVQTPDGKMHAVEISPHESVQVLREKLVKPSGIPAAKQVLKFDRSDVPSSSDGVSMKDLGIQDGSTLSVESFKIPVTVNLMNGTVIEVMVDPSDYLSDIKRQLETESDIPAKNQRLFMKGSELDDNNKTAEEYGIEAGSVLDLEPKVVEINVQTPDGQFYAVEVAPSDNSTELREKIASRTGIPAEKQKLMFNGEELPTGDTTVKDMCIKEGSTLNVSINQVPVTVNTMDGKSFEVMVDPTDKVSEIKKLLESATGLRPNNQRLFMAGEELTDDNTTAADYCIQEGSVLDLEPVSMQITVETPDGKTHDVEVSPSDTTDMLKEKIAKRTGMPAPTQLLQFEGKQLPGEGQTLREMGVRDGSSIIAEVLRVPVTVNMMDGKTIKVMVDPTDFLLGLKKQLEAESGLHPSNQRLFMTGNELVDDSRTAAEHGIGEGSVLDLEAKALTVIFRTPDGQTHAIDVSLSDTTEMVKAKIAEQTGMPESQQLLKFEGKPIPGGVDVRSMGIQNGSTIDVEMLKVPVTVNTLDGKQIKLLVDPTDTVRDIKRQLESESGLPAANQRLAMDGSELGDENRSADDYGIKAGAILDLEPKSMAIIVQTPDGATHAIEIAPSDTCDAIKDKIAKKTGMAAPRQVLKFNGNVLPSKGESATRMGIQDGSTIAVEPFKIPISAKTMDGSIIKLNVEPSSSMRDIKRQLENESQIPEKNQRLFWNGNELVDDIKTATDYGLEAGSTLDLEPKFILVKVQLPDGKTHTVELVPADTSDTIKEKIAKQTGMAAPRQVVKFQEKPLISDGHTVKELGIRDGSNLVVEVFRVPIKVKTHEGTTLSLKVEPCDTIDSVKKMIEAETGMEPKKQTLKFGDKELSNGVKTCSECGVREGSTLLVEPNSDPIIFVDIKCGTLFAVDRDDVIQQQALTPLQGNKLDFVEAAKDTAARDKILQSMKESPTLGIATQVVVQKMDIEDITLEEAEKVKSMWGVNLKKREKNKKGEEFIFVDPKTGACGELARKKYVDMNFITVVPSGKGETLAQRETDTMTYDKYVFEIRQIFGIKAAT